MGAPVFGRGGNLNYTLIPLLVIVAVAFAVFSDSRASSGGADVIHTPAQVDAGLRLHPESWLNHIIRVQGTISSVCPIQPGGGVLDTGNCALPKQGAPFVWISNGTQATYDSHQSVALEWVWHAPPAPSLGVTGGRERVYALYLRSAGPCPEEMGPLQCAVGDLNVGR